MGLFLLCVLLASCDGTSNLEIGDKPVNFPTRTSKHANINYKDSGRRVFILRAPLIEEYEALDSPFMLFRKGVEIDFYEEGKTKPGHMRADFARYEQLNKLYLAQGKVVIVNSENDSLKTDTLHWDQAQKRVYTQDTVEIIRNDGTYLMSHFGLEASEDFKTYTLYNNKGNFNIKNTELQ